MAKTLLDPHRHRRLRDLKKPFPGDSLEQIVHDYENWNLWCLGPLMQLTEIEDCICGKIGSKKTRSDGTIYYIRCRHQARIPNEAITEAAEILKGKINKMEENQDFDRLHDWICKKDNFDVTGIGPLTKYDFCIRFGFKRGLIPLKYVYLHAGSMDGAKEIKRLYPNINIKEYKEKIPIELLPAVLQNIHAKTEDFINEDPKKYRSMHIENLLCIFKERLVSLK